MTAYGSGWYAKRKPARPEPPLDVTICPRCREEEYHADVNDCIAALKLAIAAKKTRSA